MKLYRLSHTVLLASLFMACANPQPATPSPPAPSDGSVAATTAASEAPPTKEDARKFMAEVNEGLRKVYVEQGRAEWINKTYVTEDTDSLAGDAKAKTMSFVTSKIKESVKFRGVADLDPDVARQLELLRRGTDLPGPPEAAEREELASLAVTMESNYARGKYCSATLAEAFHKVKSEDAKGKSKATPAAAKSAVEPCLKLGELSQILQHPKMTYEQKLEAWKGWRESSAPMRDEYKRFVELGNKGAQSIGYRDVGELWRSRYDMPPDALEADVERLWGEVSPLYNNLHCYVRSRLAERYKGKFDPKGPIPAHLLGNMWSQTWGYIGEDVVPFPKEKKFDVTSGLVKKGLNAKQMVKTGESFFTSLGLDPLPKTFWERSLFEKPRDREVECHASAWDLTYNADVRIKMCTEVNEEDLITIHHELGHDYYFMYYHTLPVIYQDGANDGFHEGIGDTLALSVTPEYLVKIGLLDSAPDNERAELNVLMERALDKVSFLPFGMLIDKWRWDVFSGKIAPENYNQGLWDMVRKYQGVDSAVARSEKDFDAGAKYHVPANVPYLRYFLADIYQFQFHRALCRASGHKGPLHKCSIHSSKVAGDKLKAMLALGSSKPWPEAMKALTGDSKADATAIVEYFAPLNAWLVEQNKGKTCGW